MEFIEKVKNGELYYESDYTEDLIKENIENLEKIHDFNNCRPSQMTKGLEILKDVFSSIGDDCYILAPFHASCGKNIHLGNNVIINYNATMIDDTDIYIGNNVMIAPNVLITTASHPIDPELRKKVAQFNMPVHIEDGVWICSGAIILPGVRIGKDSVIGAGSVVTKDIPPGKVAYGNPCVVKRDINEHDKEFYYKDKKIRKDDESDR